MLNRRVWILMLGAIVIAAFGVFLLFGNGQSQVHYPGPESPISLSKMSAEFFSLDSSSITKRGRGRILVLRFDKDVEFVPHHFRDEKLSVGQSAEDWAQHLSASIVFNAGQFDEDLNHLGWFKKDGRYLSKHAKPKWKALLLSGPNDGAAWGRIVDLEQADKKIIDRYRHGVQSMMLVDDSEKIRVRDSGRAASRTVIAEDVQGRILVMVSEGAITLADFARWLPKQRIGVLRAMNLDGGLESQLFIDSPELQLKHYGQYRADITPFEGGGPKIKYPLPVVVAVRAAR